MKLYLHVLTLKDHFLALKRFSHNDTKPCITSMHFIVNKIYFHQHHQTQMLTMQSDVRIGSDSIFELVALCFTNQLSEVYHNAIDATQGFM